MEDNKKKTYFKGGFHFPAGGQILPAIEHSADSRMSIASSTIRASSITTKTHPAYTIAQEKK